jgi:hypothetical protein
LVCFNICSDKNEGFSKKKIKKKRGEKMNFEKRNFQKAQLMGCPGPSELWKLQ